MKIKEWIQRAREGFHPTFWVANTLELFERLAFYGAKAVLTVYPSRWVSGLRSPDRLPACFPG